MVCREWWPNLHFGPVNLFSVVPAFMFYASPDEQWKRVWERHDVSVRRRVCQRVLADKRHALMRSLVAAR